MDLCHFVHEIVRFKRVRSIDQKPTIVEMLYYDSLHVIRCVESIGEGILAIRSSVLEILSTKVDFLPIPLRTFYNGLCDRDGSWLFVFTYVKFNSLKSLFFNFFKKNNCWFTILFIKKWPKIWIFFTDNSIFQLTKIN